jgi:YidC/Oxa1 family membrane protein insertase
MTSSLATLRVLSLLVLCISLFVLGERWMEYQGNESSPKPLAASADSLPGAQPARVQDKPVVKDSLVSKAQEGISQQGELVVLQTDLMRVEVSTVGASIVRVEFLKQRDTVDPSKHFVLLEQSPERQYVAQSGLLGSGLATHNFLFESSKKKVVLVEGEEEIRLEMTALDVVGARSVVKTFRIRRGEYVINVRYDISGMAGKEQPQAYFQLVRDDSAPTGDSRWVPTFSGVAIFTEKEKYQKISYSDIRKDKASHAKTSTDGWIGIVQHYFVSAWLPRENAQREFYTRTLEKGLFSAGVVVSASPRGQGSWAVEVPLYVGPQEQDKLDKLAPGLRYTVDYGWLTVIATPLFWCLSALHGGGVSNWGLSIIVLTILIKLLFFPLSAASYRSMAKMRMLAPKLQRLKEQFSDDRQKLQQAMMNLYKTEKVNPLGGCLPVLIQIPVFISLYWVLLGSVEMRHAPFILWIRDLSSPDPFYVLPILMGISMIIQGRLNPEPPDPIQAKVMKIMPVAFSVFFFFFPAGLVLYWLINNVLSIAQQWYITRKLERVESGGGRR